MSNKMNPKLSNSSWLFGHELICISGINDILSSFGTHIVHSISGKLLFSTV